MRDWHITNLTVNGRPASMINSVVTNGVETDQAACYVDTATLRARVAQSGPQFILEHHRLLEEYLEGFVPSS